MRPIVINNFLHSARILGDACEKLQTYCIDGVQLDNDQIAQYVHRSLMLVTALSPVVGYDKATAIGNDAGRTGRTPRESALDSGAITAEDFDRIVNAPPWSDPFRHREDSWRIAMPRSRCGIFRQRRITSRITGSAGGWRNPQMDCLASPLCGCVGAQS
jgi:hypothetical protein